MTNQTYSKCLVNYPLQTI